MIRPKERYWVVYNARRNGATFKKAGSIIGVGVERARQMVFKVERYLKDERSEPKVWWFGLSERAKNCLLNADMKSREDVRNAIANRKIRPLKFPRNYGKKTHLEVLKWLGVEAGKWSI